MNKIYTFWQSNPHLWFNSTADDDKFISNEFFRYYTNSVINDYINFDELYKEDWVSYCILNDQLIKHFNRYYNINLSPPYNFINNCYVNYKLFKHHLTDFEFMFSLMPIRHTHQLIHVNFVLNETWARLSKDKNNKFIRRFLVATYERYIKCTKENNLICYIDNKLIFNHPEILDKSSPSININHIDYNHTDFNNIFNIKEFIENNNLTNEHIIISISGGVDSMVCSYLLKQLTYTFENLKISCVHIDYNNRPECKYEEELLIWWCNTILNIPLYIRRIDEINRPKCMEYELRDLYESYTKDVRFTSYNNFNNFNNSFVVLGHNKDDTIENIFTNAASCSHYDNLLGMTSISNQTFKQKNICFLRPLLNISKSEIYKYAIDNNIPFLLDSTPKWSQRGKIRDIVKPALNEWNPLIFDGLINLSEKMSQMTLLIDKLIPKDIKYDNINDIPLDSIYWSTILRKNNIYTTQKTLVNLINRLEYYKSFPHKLKDTQKIQLCKDKTLILKLQKDKLIIIL
jgi:tRNA(Ile)-lysidine synthetase-like protein